jgi:hypothetical protein
MMTDERARGQRSGWPTWDRFSGQAGRGCAVGGPSLAVFSWANQVGGNWGERHNESKIMNH